MQNRLQKSVVQCMTSPATGWVVLGLTVVFWALHGGYIRIGPPTEGPRRFRADVAHLRTSRRNLRRCKALKATTA